MILVLGSIVARKGCIAAALALSREHVIRARAEPGCITHAVHQDTENPQRLVFVEQWASQAALWQHFKLPASRSFANSLAALVAEAPSLDVFAATAVDHSEDASGEAGAAAPSNYQPAGWHTVTSRIIVFMCMLRALISLGNAR